MNDRDLLHHARKELTHNEFKVWFAKHYAGHGRRSGSLALGITEDAWRHRLRTAEAKLAPHLDKENAA